MSRIIYADLLFIINFFADFFIIYLTAMFSDIGVHFSRLLLSSSIGAILGTLILCIENNGLATSLLVILIPCLLCFIAFGKRSLRTFGNIVLYFYLSSAMLYGGMYTMISLISLFLQGITIPQGFMFTILLIISTSIIYIFLSSLFSRGLKNKENRIKAELFDGRKKYDLTFLVDSGNLAKDPFTAKPVVIVSAGSLDADLLNAVCRSLDNTNSPYTNIKPRVIPMKTVSGTALLYAFVPESMHIYLGKKRCRADCIIAIDQRENAFFGKDGIIPETLLHTV